MCNQWHFVDWWWVCTCVLVCLFLYERGLNKNNLQFQQLKEQFETLQAEKKQALVLQADLQKQINSQSDIAWIELTLIKTLGLVPENQQKVYFTAPN
jgi:hypothetical protein